MQKVTYNEFEDAVNTLGLIGLESKEKLKKRYLKISKQYHPDMPEGDLEKFQDINKAYKIVSHYVDNFRYRFTKEEFQNQFPFSLYEDMDWISGKSGWNKK